MNCKRPSDGILCIGISFDSDSIDASKLRIYGFRCLLSLIVTPRIQFPVEPNSPSSTHSHRAGLDGGVLTSHSRNLLDCENSSRLTSYLSTASPFQDFEQLRHKEEIN